MTSFREDLAELVALVGPQRYADARLALDTATQLAALRERRNLTQRQLAERLGKTQQAISKMENPTHAGHNLARLAEVAAALDAALDVTIVPLEDLPAYESLRPPKPALEDIQARAMDDHPDGSPSRAKLRRVRRRAAVTVGGGAKAARLHRNGDSDLRSPRQLVETAANG